MHARVSDMKRLHVLYIQDNNILHREEESLLLHLVKIEYLSFIRNYIELINV